MEVTGGLTHWGINEMTNILQTASSKSIYFDEHFCMLIEISHELVLKCPIHNNSYLTVKWYKFVYLVVRSMRPIVRTTVTICSVVLRHTWDCKRLPYGIYAKAAIVSNPQGPLLLLYGQWSLRQTWQEPSYLNAAFTASDDMIPEFICVTRRITLKGPLPFTILACFVKYIYMKRSVKPLFSVDTILTWMSVQCHGIVAISIGTL